MATSPASKPQQQATTGQVSSTSTNSSKVTIELSNETSTITAFLKLHSPVVIGVVLVALNYLIDSGNLTLSAHTLNLINAVLAASGLTILHVRQQS